MSFSKRNSDLTKTPWVKVTVPADGRSNNETERLLNTNSDDDEVVTPTVEAIPCVDPQQKEVVVGEVEEDDDDHSQYPKAVVAASGTAGCVLGCLVGGVVCAVMGGLGSAYAAKHKAGTCLGDTARAMGEVALMAQEKAVAVNEKHDVAKTTQEAAKSTLEKAKAMDEKYQICEKSKNAIASAGKATIDFAARHQLVERSVEGVGRGMEFVGGKITGSSKQNNSNPSAS